MSRQVDHARCSIGLVLIVKNEAAFIEHCLGSVKSLISSWLIVDTGSTDGTQTLVKKSLKKIKGELFEREWVDFGTNRTEALALAKGTAEWLLMPDADMTFETHPEFLTWLETDPDPETDAWMVEIVDGIVWQLPLLIRGDKDWEFIGPVHEYLDTSRIKRRPLLGLTAHHHGGNRHPIQKFDQYLTLLKPGVEKGDPRSIFYSAECLRYLGCIPQAVEMYQQRASMNGFEEEAWYAAYQAARLSRNVTDLLKAHERRPWRAEPLAAAAELVRTIPNEDVLFIEGRAS